MSPEKPINCVSVGLLQHKCNFSLVRVPVISETLQQQFILGEFITDYFVAVYHHCLEGLFSFPQNAVIKHTLPTCHQRALGDSTWSCQSVYLCFFSAFYSLAQCVSAMLFIMSGVEVSLSWRMKTTKLSEQLKRRTFGLRHEASVFQYFITCIM